MEQRSFDEYHGSGVEFQGKQSSFRANNRSDANWMSELRAVVMRPDLERLGRYGPCGVRRGFLDGFVPARTRVIAANGEHEDPTDVYLDAHPFTIEHLSD